MDPHETILDYRDSKGARVTGKRFTMEEFRQYPGQMAAFNGVLDFKSSNSHYNGTLFRFPFRNREFHSEISDRTYTRKDALRVLYESLAQEAHRVLLFLNNVTDVEVYDGNPCALGQPLLQITVNSHEVQGSRAWYKSACNAFSWNQGYADTYLNKCTVTVEGQLAEKVGTVGTSSWLICSTIGVKDHQVIELASKLKVIPWVGLAAPISPAIAVGDCRLQNEACLHINCASVENQVSRAVSRYRRSIGWTDPPSTLSNGGFAFCFLPMSATTSTGLPVHIHGYFTLSDNRRRVRWPDADDNSDEANWNKHLVEHLIAPSYAILMTARCMMTSYQGFPLAHTTLQKSADPYALLPVMSEVKEEVWKHLIYRVQPLLSQLPALWTAANNGMWVKPPNAFFIPLDASVPTSVVDLLLQLNCPVVCLPRNVQVSCTTLGCMFITPDVARDFLRRDVEIAARILRENKHLLEETLRYVFSNGFKNLQGLPLVPLQQAGRVGTFSSQTFYVLPKSDLLASQVLHGLEGQIVSSSLPSDLQACFIQLARSNQFRLQLATADVICPNLLRAAIQTWCHNPNAPSITWSPSQYNQPPASWLSCVWRYIADNGKLCDVAGLPLIATTCPDKVPNKGSVTLYALKGSESTILRKTSASSKQVQSIAKTLGCTLVNDSHLYAPFDWQLDQYLPVLSSTTFFAALQFIPNVASTAASLDNAQKRCLRKYLAEAVSSLVGSLNGQQIALLQSLPMYEIGVDSRHTTFVQLGYWSQEVFPHYSITFPSNLAFPSQILKVSEADQQLIQPVLQRPPLSFGALVQQHIFNHAVTQCNTEMRNQILMWIIEMSQPQLYGKLEQFIRRNACIPASDNTLRRVDALYDPEDSKLQEFFHSCEAKSPSDDFKPVFHKLRQFGLNTWHTVTQSDDTFGTFLQDRLQSVQLLLSRGMDKEARQRSKLILQAIANHAQCQYLLQCVHRQCFLFCEQSRPNGYPEQLHWVGSGAAQLFSPSELCASSDMFQLASLVGSVCPILDNSYTDSVRRLKEFNGTSCFLSVTDQNVLQHFTNITDLSANALKSQHGSWLFGRVLGYVSGGQVSVNSMVEYIYEFLSSNNSRCFQQWTRSCVWNSEQCVFVEKCKVALRPLEGFSLAPYRYSAQDLSCLHTYSSMWLDSGVKDQFTVQDGVQVVSEVKTSKCKLNAIELDIVVNIANVLKENKDKADYVKDMYLPSKSCMLHRPEDLTYHDHYLDIPESEQGVNFIHPRITSDVACFFGVISLSIRAAPSQSFGIEFECTGPYESITQRIKGLVEDYGDSIDVFKELIQNADDAGATEVKFLIDWRTHTTGKLFTMGMAKWQGPALYAYNNEVFSDEDLKNISKVAGATKKQDHTKIGRFGVGFCATYHLTDVPSFITRRWLQVFDPHLKYLGERVQPNKPGMQIDFVKERAGLKKYFSDQVAPYQGVFGCNVFGTNRNGFNGTLFRFPFRQQGIVSDISSEVFTEGSRTIESLKSSLFQSADTLLLFLQNVNKVELFECRSGDSLDKMQKVFEVARSHPKGGTFERQFRIPRERFKSVKPCSQKMKIVTSVGNGRQQPQEAMWEVSSAMGRGPSLQHANSQDGRSQGLVPVAEVAVRIRKEGQSIAIDSTMGTVSCFLPLPIETSLNFVVNAFFDVSKDRRVLKGVQSSSHDTWNVMLMKDALIEAVFTLLVALTKKAPVKNPATMEKFLTAYYNIFPLERSVATKPDSVRPFLAEQFEKRLPNHPEALIWSACNNGCWLRPSEVVVLDVQFTEPPLPHKMQYDVVFALLVQQNVPIAQVPPGLKRHFRRMDFEEFCRTRFLGKIHQVPSGIRDQLMLFILNNYHSMSARYGWLKGLLSGTPCIPCKPHNHLCKPGNLVMETNPLLANLFDETEGHFPASEYEAFSSVLGTLGAAVHKLRSNDVFNRARSVLQLLEAEGVDRANKRSSDLVNYLMSCHYHRVLMRGEGPCKLSPDDARLAEELSNIDFLPVLGQPDGISICWLGDSGTFACSRDLFLPDRKNYVFATGRILNSTLFKSNFTDLDRILTFCHGPNVHDVLLQLKRIIEWWHNEASVSAEEKELISCATQSIYTNLLSQGAVQQQKAQTVVKKELDGVPFIWKDGFHLARQVFLEESIECPPYLIRLQEAPASCLSLFSQLGVNKCASDDQLVDMLRQIANDFGEEPVSETILHFAIMVATTRLSCCWKMSGVDQDSEADSNPQCDDSNKARMRNQLFLPDTTSVMRPCTQIMYMDRRDLKWLEKNDTFLNFAESDGIKRYYLHPKISWGVADSLGIESPLEALLNSYSDDSFMDGLDYGQYEDLCTRLNGILEGYHADTSIFKEFVQNADDAGASEIAFVLDQRKFKAERLLSKKSNWKKLQEMPSLMVFNDKKFSDEDIKGITNLGRGGKQNTPETIGRFGIGFNVAYHVTDCPMFVSHKEGGQPEHFCVFDPNCTYAPLPSRSPGRRWELSKNQGQLYTVVVDQMKPYSEETLSKLQKADPGSFAQMSSPQKWKDGYVLFRLPLTRESAESPTSRLTNGNKTTTVNLQRNLVEFSHEAAHTLLFLNSVKRISIYEISAEGKCTVIGSCHAEASPEDQQKCSDFAQRAKEERRKLKVNQAATLQTVQRVYQVEISGIQTEISDIDTTSTQLRSRHLSSRSRKQQTSTAISSSWIISKRFGGTDIDTNLLATGYKHSFLPLGGVAAQGPTSPQKGDVFAHHPREGKVFCYLPLPKSLCLPVHMNGHFWLNHSRRELQFSDSDHVLKDWNKAICNDVICKAYAELLLYCRDVRTEKGEFVQDWYYKLYPECSTGSLPRDFLHLPEHLYLFLFVHHATVLLALQDQPEARPQWLALTNENGPTKGWFYSECCELESTLLKLGMKLTAAPMKVACSVEASLWELSNNPDVMYTGNVTPAVLRDHLRTLCPQLATYKTAIVEAIVPLLAYCMKDVNTQQLVKWKAILEGVPLMLTRDDELRKMHEVFEDQYAALLPQCNNVFVHEKISSKSVVCVELQTLGYIKPLQQDPLFVANHLILSRSDIINFPEDSNFKLTLALFWKFFKVVNEDSRHLFNDFTVVPTTDGRLFPFSKCKNIMFQASNKALIRMLCLPVVDFGCIFKGQLLANMRRSFSSYFANADNADDIIHLLSVYKDEILQRSITPEVVDVQDLLHFLEESKEVKKKEMDICWMQSLPLFKLVSGKLSTINSFAKAYDVSNIPHEGLAEISLLTSTAFVIIPKYSTQFMQRVGVRKPATALEVLELYGHELVPNFKLLPAVDIPKLVTPHIEKLHELSRTLGIKEHKNRWDGIFHILAETPFIEAVSGPKCVKELYDPKNVLLKTCLPENSFPPPPWDSSKWLKFFRHMGLCCMVSEQLWLQIARDVAHDVQNDDDDQKCEEKAKWLLKDLVSKMMDAVQCMNPADGFRQFLCDAAEIKFVPCENQLQPSGTLVQALPDFQLPHQGWTTLRGSVLQVKVSDYQLACISHPVLPRCFNPQTEKTASFLKLLDVKSLDLYPAVVAKNLVALTHLLEGCKELSFEHRSGTVSELHELFQAHYQFLNRVHSSSLDNIVPILQGAKCILVKGEDGSTFNLLPGSQVVAEGLKDSLQQEEMFSPLLQSVPEEFQALKDFLRMAGVAKRLEVSHCLFVLRHVFKEGIQDNPNNLSCATAAYNNLVKLLRKAESNLEGSVLECLEADVIPLLSKDQQLLPASQLILDDVQQYSERVTPESLPGFKLVMPPPKDDNGNHSLPACLGVHLLSSIIAEHPHPHMLHDKNACTKERRAAAEGKEHGCEFVTATIEMLTSGEFFRGIVRIVKHDNQQPPSDETVEDIKEKLREVTVKCLQVIKTVLLYKEDNRQVPNSENESILCLVLEGEESGATVYIAPHYAHALNRQYNLLHQLSSGLNRYLGGIIKDNGLLVQMLMCSSPRLIDGVLTSAGIPNYVHGSEQQPSPSKIGQMVRYTEQLDNVIVCTFRVDDIVKFCDAEGQLIYAQVVSISCEGQNELQTCRLRVKLSNSGDASSIVEMVMSPLVMSKYLYSQQRAYIASEWQVEVAHSTGGADVTLQPLSVLPLAVKNKTTLKGELTRLYTTMMSTFSQPQVLHVSIRLVHHLHYLCTQKHCVNKYKTSTGVLLQVLKNVVRDPSILQRVKQEIETFLPPETIPLEVSYSQAPQPSVQTQAPMYGGGGGGYSPTGHIVSVWNGGGGRHHHGYGGGGRHHHGYGGGGRQYHGYGGGGRQHHGYGGGGRQHHGYGGGYHGYTGVTASVWQPPAIEPPPQPNLVDAKMWLTQALNDYEAAKVLLEDSKQKLEEQDEESLPLLVQVFPAQVCFLAHESMEKCLKSLFLALFGLRRQLAEHTNVADLCKELQDNQHWFHNPPVDLMPQVLVVSSHFLRCRYPEHNIPKMAPAEAYRYNFEEAIEAVSAVEKFLRTVRELPKEEVTQMFDAIDHSMPMEAEMQVDPNSELHTSFTLLHLYIFANKKYNIKYM